MQRGGSQAVIHPYVLLYLDGPLRLTAQEWMEPGSYYVANHRVLFQMELWPGDIIKLERAEPSDPA